MGGVIIYSSFFPKIDQLFRGIDFLNTVKTNFSNYKVYIGIQVDSIPQWEKTINDFKSEGLDINYGFVNPNLYVNSDVSGFQKAIELMKNDLDSINGEFIWFGHSKGVTTGNIEYHKFAINNFWGKKEFIEDLLNSDESYGCFGNEISYLPNYDKKRILEIWQKYSNIEPKKEVIPYMFVNTFYVVKLKIFKEVLDKSNDVFFNQKLIGRHGDVGDRYFFERDFIHFVDILGYSPIFEGVAPNCDWGYPDINTIKDQIELWKKS